MEGKGSSVIDIENYLRFERVDAVERTDAGLLAKLHGEQLRVEPVRDDVLRIKISRGGIFDDGPTFAVVADTSAGAEFSASIDDHAAVLKTTQLVVTVQLDPFRIDVHRPDGSAVVETARDDVGYLTYATLNDAFTVARRCLPEDAIYGLGEKTGHQDRKGRDFTLWNTDVLDPRAAGEFTKGKATDDPRGDFTSTEFDPYYVSIPFFYHQSQLSGKMSGSFVDNGYRGNYEFSNPEQYRFHFSGGQYTEYIFAGPGMPQILEAYTWLTGRAALPPIWALGYHQCRWFKYTQEAVEAMAKQHRDHGIPCDALWLDIDYMDGYRVFTWNKESFPDLESLTSNLSGMGFRLVTIIDPGVKYEPGYHVFDQAVDGDVLCRTEGGDIYVGQVWPGKTAFPDFVTEEAREWWGQLNAEHVKSGIAGIWNDMNEPSTGSIPSSSMRFGNGEYSHERYHNQYALLMAMGTTSGLLEAMPELRTFVLSRAGSAGIQRYAANWLGDNVARWDHLWMSMPMAAGFGISGQPFVGADIGGFAENTTPELFLRWMQYGTLTPFCRNHSMSKNYQYAWVFGQTVLKHVREAIRLRYRLMPYIYSSFVRASETGEPVQRPLVFDFQYDATVTAIDDEYLFGRDLLVAPVLAAGTTARQVYLPAGRWYDWRDDAAFEGNQHVIVPTPMDRIPLYARGGAVIPMWPEAPDSTSGYFPDVVELHFFVPEDDSTHRSLLQEDDGLTFAANDGDRLRTSFTASRSGHIVTLHARATGSGFPESLRQAFLLLIHGASPRTVRIDGETVEVGRTDGRASVEIPNTGQSFTVEFALP